MDSTDSELALDLSPMMRIYEDGRVERLTGTETVPPSFDPKTNVESKDIVYSLEHHLSVRLYLPKNTQQNQKLPLLIYFYGGSFLLGSAFSPGFHNYLNSLVFEAKIIEVSVDYRLAPENPVPAAYEDSWTTLKWVASHFNGKGSEDWLNRHADFQRVFLSGDSAGANIANRMAIKHGHEEKLEVINVKGIILCCPYFWGNEIIAAVQVFVSEKNLFRERGWYYAAKVRESGWSGDLEVTDFNGEDHDFHLIKPTCEKAVAMPNSIVSFINLEQEKDDYGMEI
ncbi:hypothetical protein LWI29_035410 [Acer saccharum]|uniref:Alpha/beta hydrolase fold-3 domain-containing protein n=1 Tax=Acer saccharum TaxID=4024 RepID=A0AA39RY16_ACESA|nr:hypothetical protein LWI29_035410 [Acer saccharum]